MVSKTTKNRLLVCPLSLEVELALADFMMLEACLVML